MPSIIVSESEYIVQLDPPIPLAQDGIGRRLKIRVGDNTGFITLPKVEASHDSPIATPRKWPVFPGYPSSHVDRLTSNVSLESGTVFFPHAAVFHASALRVRLNRNPTMSSTKRSAEIYREIVQIVAIARNWLAAWTRIPQIVIHQNMYPYGIGADLIGDVWRAYFLPGSSVLYPQSDDGIPFEYVKVAIRAGSVGHDVPPEHQLLTNSESGIFSLQHRTTVIDLCCAAELALSSRVRLQLDESSTRTNSSKSILRGVTGIVELFRIYDGMFGSALSVDDVREKLAAVRNKAVHEGVEPSVAQLKLAMEVARRLVFEASPLESPVQFLRLLPKTTS